MLITKNDIEILKNGDWYFQGNRIDNQNVLNYFKANLGRDEEGYFILNRFGKRLEKGYLKAVRGFALFVARISVVGRKELGDRGLLQFRNAEEVENDFSKAFSKEEYLFQCELDAGTKYLLPLFRLCLFDERTLALRLNAEKKAPLYARLSASAMASLWEHLAEDKEDYVFVIPSSNTGEGVSFALPKASFEEVLYERNR